MASPDKATRVSRRQNQNPEMAQNQTSWSARTRLGWRAQNASDIRRIHIPYMRKQDPAGVSCARQKGPCPLGNRPGPRKTNCPDLNVSASPACAHIRPSASQKCDGRRLSSGARRASRREPADHEPSSRVQAPQRGSRLFLKRCTGPRRTPLNTKTPIHRSRVPWGRSRSEAVFGNCH